MPFQFTLTKITLSSHHLVLPSVVVFNVLQISFSGFLPEPFKISKNGFLHITLHTSAQNILKLQVPRSKALGGVWTESSKMSPLLYNNRLITYTAGLTLRKSDLGLTPLR